MCLAQKVITVAASKTVLNPTIVQDLQYCMQYKIQHKGKWGNLAGTAWSDRRHHTALGISLAFPICINCICTVPLVLVGDFQSAKGLSLPEVCRALKGHKMEGGLTLSEFRSAEFHYEIITKTRKSVEEPRSSTQFSERRLYRNTDAIKEQGVILSIHSHLSDFSRFDSRVW